MVNPTNPPPPAAAQRRNIHNNYYNPTLHEYSQHGNDMKDWFQNAPVTKCILIMNIICYIVIYHNVTNKTTFDLLRLSNTSTSNNNIYVLVYQYVISKMIFFPYTKVNTYNHHSITTYDNHTNQNTNNTNTLIIILFGTIIQFHLYRTFERQMSSYQFIRFILFIYTISIILQYLLFTSTVINSIPILSNITTTTTNNIFFGPYNIIGALTLYYHWYIPRLYPKFITIFNVQFSEKTIFYISIFYFILISNYSNNNHQLQVQSPVQVSDQMNHTYLFKYSYSMIVTIHMIMGMIGTIIYYYISTNSILLHYDSIIHLHIIQPLIQRIYTFLNLNNNNNNNTNRGSSTSRPRISQQQHQQQGRGIQQQQLQQQLHANIRQRYNTNNNMTPNNETNTGTATINNNNNQHEQQHHEQIIPLPEANTEMIEQLCSMGFQRQNVIDALRLSHNNIEHAAHRLLVNE